MTVTIGENCVSVIWSMLILVQCWYNAVWPVVKCLILIILVWKAIDLRNILILNNNFFSLRGCWMPGQRPLMYDMPQALQTDIAMDDAGKLLGQVCKYAKCSFPANTRCWPNVGLMLGQWRRQWADISPALGHQLVCAGFCHFTNTLCVISNPSTCSIPTKAQRIVLTMPASEKWYIFSRIYLVHKKML